MALRVDLNEGDVVASILADEFCLVARQIAKCDLDGLRALHHMIVRQNVSVGINQEARTRSFDRHGIVEEIVLDGARNDISDRRRRLKIYAYIFRCAEIEETRGARRRK